MRGAVLGADKKRVAVEGGGGGLIGVSPERFGYFRGRRTCPRVHDVSP